MQPKLFSKLFLCLSMSLFLNCAYTHLIMYPPADELFITSGDDPGTESPNPYIPKGQIIHVKTAYYLPIPILGLIDLVRADPQYVFNYEVIPEIKKMGGDALINANVQYIPPPNFFIRLILPFLATPEQTIVYGTVVKRPSANKAVATESSESQNNSEALKTASAPIETTVKTGSTKEYYDKAVAAIKNGQFNEAIDYSSKAITSDSTFSKAYKSRGYAYMQLRNIKNYEKACADLNKYLKTDNNSENDFDKVRDLIKSMGFTPEK